MANRLATKGAVSVSTKKALIAKYTRDLAKMLSDSDFERYFGSDVKQKIIKYSDLKNYSDITQLLPENFDYKIILTETTAPNTGHWCVLIRMGDVFEWFDGYGDKGAKPDGELSFIPSALKKMFGEDKHYLSHLLKDARKRGGKVEYNKVPLQVMDQNVDTCGRWAIARLKTAQLGYSLKDFQRLIREQSEQQKKPPDILMCDWII